MSPSLATEEGRKGWRVDMEGRMGLSVCVASFSLSITPEPVSR